MAVKLPNCYKCKHHFITFRKNRPYGCRAYGFMSKVSPSRVVYESSGIVCQLYTEQGEGGSGSDGMKGGKKGWVA